MMINGRTFLLAVFALLIPITQASSHPDAGASGCALLPRSLEISPVWRAILASHGAATPSEAERKSALDLQHTLQFMVHLLAYHPPQNRAKLWDEAQFLNDFLDPARKPPPTAEQTTWVVDHMAEVLRQTVSQFTCISVVWTPGGLEPSSANLHATEGIPRAFLFELTNTTTAPLQAVASFEESPNFPNPSYRIPAGESRLLVAVLDLKVAPADGHVRLRITSPDSTEPPRSIRLPVAVSKAARLRGQILDGDSSTTTAARVSVLCSDGQFRHAEQFASNTTLSQKQFLTMPRGGAGYFMLPFFYADGNFDIAIPHGETTVSVERGFEHAIVSTTITLGAGETQEITLRPKRTLDARALGYVSGDTHVHWVKNHWSENEELALLRIVQRAEDLRVINNLTLFQHVDPPGQSFTKPDQYGMGPVPGMCDQDYHVQMGEEFRNDDFYGHICLLGIDQLIVPVATGRGSGGPVGAVDYPTNAAVIAQAHERGGIVTEAHNLGPFGRGSMPAHVVLGLSDSLDQLMPDHYYRFLDAGILIPISDGSDHPARTAGEVRVYVKTDPTKPLFEGWIDGIRNRHTFTTSGPLLFLTVNGKPPGSVLDVAPGETVTVRAEAFSRRPIGNLQIITNGGKILAAKSVFGTSDTLTATITAKEPLWIAARCAPGDNYYGLTQRDVAHTSGVFVDVAGKRHVDPAAVRTWIQLLGWNLAAIEQQGTFATGQQRQEATQVIRDGIAAFEELLR